MGVCQESGQILGQGLARRSPRGPADPNAPSGASTAGPPFVGGRFGANDCILQVADSLSTFDVCVLGYARHSQISEFLCMFLIFSVDSHIVLAAYRRKNAESSNAGGCILKNEETPLGKV